MNPFDPSPAREALVDDVTVEVRHDRRLVTAPTADLAWFAELVAAAQARRPPPATIEAQALRRTVLEASSGPMARGLPEGVTPEPVDADGVPACWFRPPEAARTAPLLYLHGGGYVCGSVEAERGVAAALAQAFRAPVLALGYRQAPEHPFPAALEDAWRGFAWLARRGGGPITLAGASAGGTLAVATAVRAGREMPGVAHAVIATSAWFDLSMSGASWRTNRDKDVAPAELGAFFRRCYLGDPPDERGLVRLTEAELRLCPPLLVQVGADEIALDDAESTVSLARLAAVETQYEVYVGMPHNFIKFPRRIGDYAIERMALWEAELPRP